MNDSQLPRKDNAIKAIRWVAVGGVGIGFLSLVLLVLLARHQFTSPTFFDLPVCGFFSEPTDFNADERHWNWDGGDSAEIALADVTVRYGDGGSNELVAKGSRTALAHIEVRDGRIRSSCRNFPGGKVTLILPAIRFRHIGIAGPGRVELMDVEQPDLEIKIVGPGSIYSSGKIGHIDAHITGPGTLKLAGVAMDSLDLKVIGPGSVYGDGKIANVDVHITGPGKLKLAGVAMDSLDLNVIGPATVEAGPKNKAHIHVVGPAKIRLLSHPPVLEKYIVGPTNITYASDN